MSTKIFDYCVSNPPYQFSDNVEERKFGQNSATRNIFPYFYDLGCKISDSNIMIFPGGRWMQRQNRASQASQLIMPSFSKVWWYPNGEERDVYPVFNDVKITDGVSIVLCNSLIPLDTVMVNDVPMIRPRDNEILPLQASVVEIAANIKARKLNTINSRRLTINLFGIRGYYVERNPSKVVPVTSETVSAPFEGAIRAWLGDANLGSAKRVKEFWISRDEIIWTPLRRKVFHQWKVCTSQASASKRPEIAKYYILPSECVIGESLLIVGAFDDEDAAVNYMRYISSAPVRSLLAASKGGNVRTWGCFVEDLNSYTTGCGVFGSAVTTLTVGHNVEIEFEKLIAERLGVGKDFSILT